jgi:L-threonylcarbamoyladenylate synthase
MPNVLPLWRAALTARNLCQGDIIAYPTEGVWGLGCLPELEQSVAHILHIKRRRWDMGLILVASKFEHVEHYLAGVGDEARSHLEKVWPSAVTYLIPDNGVAPMWIKGRHHRVALRLSAHPVVRSICDHLGGPIVSTSANPTGREAAKSALRVRQYFGNDVDQIVAGPLGGETGASEIRDLMSGDILRQGA